MEQTRCLVVDLDGTLLRSDMLFETLWAALSQNWRAGFGAMRNLFSGRAALKHHLSTAGDVDVSRLPYNEAVIAYIKEWRATGGRTALVTASNAGLARAVADHLGLFDEVHGSDQSTNLKGARKAAFLTARFGPAGFDYMGDSRADLPVWQAAARAITVDVSPHIEAQLRDMGRETLALPASDTRLSAWLRVLRPHQWLKNLLLFLPVLAAHQTGAVVWAQALLGFVAFSLMASSAYTLNDMLDLDADRAHPRKRLRPFAAGNVPLAHGTLMVPVLALAGLGLGAGLGLKFLAVLGAYYAVTLAYSLFLKRQVIIDICTLAGLYGVRIVAGGAATGIALSHWLLAFAVAFFFALAAVKRQTELVDAAKRAGGKLSGRGYRVEDLPLVMAMATSAGYVAVLIFAVYITSNDVLRLYSQPNWLWAACLILFYWINRVLMLTHRGEMHDDPVVFAVKDQVSLVCLGLVVAVGALAS